MTRPRPERDRDHTGHLDDCRRPFMVWRTLYGASVGVCQVCGAVLVGRPEAPERTEVTR